MIEVTVNGEKIQIKENSTLQELLEELGIVERVMASAVNMEIVKKEHYTQKQLKDGDRLELLDFVGGG